MPAKTSEKIISDPEIGEVTFRKSVRCSRLSIRVHPVRGVTVTMPYMVPYAAASLFFKSKRQWVIETMARQKERMQDVPAVSSGEIETMRRKAKETLPARLAELAGRHGFIYNRVAIKHNATNWGSCSTKGNINLNLNIMRLPAVLQDYVLLHELCHLRHHDHSHAFHLLLEYVLTDNLMRLLPDKTDSQPESRQDCQSDDNGRMAYELARKAAASKARYPLDYTFTRAIRRYRLV